MGAAEIDKAARIVTIHSHIVTYGGAADEEVTARIRQEIETLWNEPDAHFYLGQTHYRVHFRITGECRPEIPHLEIIQNTDPRNNFFRIENRVHGDISFVDGLGCNTGYFKRENLYEGSTTAAHEYGHTLGLDHPQDLDLRGKGRPGIMYPRGTLTDPEFQYDPAIPAGAKGGTLHPMHRRVLPSDIEALKLHHFPFPHSGAIVGQFTNIYHWPHKFPGA